MNKIAAELRVLQWRKSARRAVSLLNGKEEPPIARRHRLQITFSPVMMKAPAMHGVDFQGLQFSDYRLTDELPTVYDRLGRILAGSPTETFTRQVDGVKLWGIEQK